MNGREMCRQTSATQTNVNESGTEQTDGRKCRKTPAARAAKGGLSNNGINAKDNLD